MSNVKISQLPEYTGNTANTWLVMNNSGETTTYKVLLETVLQSGTSGTSGTSGSAGTSGSSGVNGTSGTAGTAGSSGTSGSSGSNGSSGTSGSSGSNGSSGTSGSSGSNGSSGTSGSSGSNGSSGTSGTSGTSGSSGDSLFALTGSVWNTTNNVGITGSLYVSGVNHIIYGNENLNGQLFLNGITGSQNKSILFGSYNSALGSSITYDVTQSGSLNLTTTGAGSIINIGTNTISGSPATKININATNTSGSNNIYGNTTISGSLINIKSTNFNITGSANLSTIMTLAKQATLPTGDTGSLAVSGSSLYFYNGTAWKAVTIAP